MGFHFRCSTRRHVTGQQGDAEEQQRNRGEAHQIARADLVQEARHKSDHYQRRNRSSRKSQGIGSPSCNGRKRLAVVAQQFVSHQCPVVLDVGEWTVTDTSWSGARQANGRSSRALAIVNTAVVPGLGVKTTIDEWLAAAAISAGRLFRCVCRAGKHWGNGVTERLVWHVVKQYARKLGLAQVAPHDLRRSCAKLCHASGGELGKIQFLLGHVSVQTTERYLGCKQRIPGAVHYCISIEP
jgi:hypothetical protein